MKYDTLRIRTLRARGLTYSEIMELLGCCKETIRRAVTDDIDAFNKKNAERQKRYRERLRNGTE